jgi:regulator of RNase E activity RraB
MNVDELKKRFAFDGAIKKSLRENNDDENKIHRIEHHFIAGTAQCLHSLAGCAKGLGYETSVVTEGKDRGQSYWYFDVYSDRDTRFPSITREAILMGALAEAFAAVYDGWGTLIAK